MRTVAVTLSRMFTDLVDRVLFPDVRLELLERVDERWLAADRLRALQPRLVLLGLLPGESDEIARVLLSAVPQSAVLAFASDGRHAFLHRMPNRRLVLPLLTVASLRRAMADQWP